MTSEEYQRICARLARKAIRYAEQMVADEGPRADAAELREHWLDVFLDEHLPDIDADALLAVTGHADAWVKALGPGDAGKAVRAVAAFQADVWDAINRVTSGE